MKKFTKQEILELYGQVTLGEISFSRMVEIMNEMVSESEVSKFKDGDFVYEDGRIMIVKNYPNMYHANAYPKNPNIVCYNAYYGVDFSEPTFRYATEEEKQVLIDAMKKDGKRWNAEKMCIEDIPQPRFKIGDKVRIKDGISSKTSRSICFVSPMDNFIGKELTVKGYRHGVYVFFNEDKDGYNFHEDWLELYVEELKKGDLAIFWDNNKRYAVIKLYEQLKGSEEWYYKHEDNNGSSWKNAIKFESREQYERFIKGEI